ncbi:MAG TPA: SPASM domain-containing protein [Defluviitoga tunisiensis]|nr:SPASM domain-containing protein [Defluviitoga tunisiensis]HOL87242.1 SPASM domain-containing protein [Defluviitoga tunisiensis]HPP10168.1 SPASM domain-containing protein [Defluviitoga tunisiensis]HPZ29584.1 SPASM domain-containing protein [Defluviitoga sp.]
MVMVTPVVSKDPSLALPKEVEELVFYEYIQRKDSHFELDELENYIHDEMILNRAPMKYFCDLGINSYTVTTSGDVYPCQLLVNKKVFKIGNITDGKEILNNKLKFYASKQKEVVDKSKYEQCKKCYLQYFCTSCPASNYLLNGTMTPTFSECETNRQNIIGILLEYVSHLKKENVE